MASPVAARAPRRTLLAGVAVAALGIGALGAGDANAAFTIGECQGSGSVTGQGASFQADLHRSFATTFAGSLIGCGGSPAAPRFTPNGSGSGLMSAGAGGTSTALLCVTARSCTAPLAAGARDLTASFQATDDPPTRQQYADMQAGDPATAADDAKLHVVPVATGAAVLIMRLPQGCSIKSDGAPTLTGSDVGDEFRNGTQRPKLSSQTVEAAFAGAAGARTWGQLVPTISGTLASAQYADVATDCAQAPVRRIVRTDNSGTTYSWKAYLNLINGSRGWTDRYAGNPNTTWPVDGTGSTRPATIDPASRQICAFSASNVCSNTGTGGGALADAVNLVEGSIGYVDLATARGRGFWNSSTSASQDQTIWIPLEVDPSRATGRYAEPTLEPSAHNSANVNKGASCGDVTVQNAPDPARSPNGDATLGDWSAAYAAGGTAGYPACVLTYGLLWDDNAVVYGTGGDQQERARTVKDYFTRIVSAAGQATLLGADYSPVPQPLLRQAQAGVAAIDWNKSAGGGTDRQPDTRVPDTRVPDTRVPDTRAPPSNAFSIPSGRATASLITYVVQVPGAGSLKVAATARVGKKTIKVSSLSASPKGASRLTLRLKLSAAAKQALAKAKSKKLAVTVKFTYTPAGGTAKTQTKTVTVKAAKKPVKKKAAKR